MHRSDHRYYVYIVASRSHARYCGVSKDLKRRVTEHEMGEMPEFSARYRCHRLVRFESLQYVGNAIAREEQIERSRRDQKIWLIEVANPTWADLSDASGEDAGPSTPPSLRAGSGRRDKHPANPESVYLREEQL